MVQGEDNGTISAEEITKYGINEAWSKVKETGIPEYWVCVLINSKFFEINKKDEDVLQHLKNITIKLSEDSLDFTVIFHFGKNDFFDNETLTKSFVYCKTTYETISATSTVPNWKEGKNPANQSKTKKTKSKNII